MALAVQANFFTNLMASMLFAVEIKYLGNFFTFFLFAIIDCLACKFQPFLTHAIADAPSVVSQLPSFSKKCQKPRDSL